MKAPNKALVRMQTTLRFVCTAQLGRYVFYSGGGKMKRDWDLIREILLEIEESHDIEDFMNHVKGENFYSENLRKYGKSNVKYHIDLLVEAGFIRAVNTDYGDAELTGLTWKGHEYAEKLRDNERWEKIKAYIAEKGLDLGSDTIMTLMRRGIDKIIGNVT